MAARSYPSVSVVLCVLALAVSACGGQPQQTPLPQSPVATNPAATNPGATASSGPSAAVTTTAPASPVGTPAAETPAAETPPAETPSLAPPTINGPAYDNPVFNADFPDPHVILADGTYYAYSTNSVNQNVPVISSTDLAAWDRERDAMPALPSWAMPNFGNTWAPGVIQIGESFVLYFVAHDRDSDRQCIGAAVGDSPTGPFLDSSDEAFVCQSELGGSIDPYPFVDDDGQRYLYWKNDGNCCAKPVGLWVQAVSDDGLKLTGEPVELVRRDQAWEIPLIENPAMVEDDGSYYLFYSGNWWESYEYAVGYAVCDSVTGPCEKPLDGPLFEYTLQVFGPGGEAFFTDADGDLVMVYHAWPAPNVGYASGGRRSLYIDPVTFENGAPVITGPTSDPQPLP